MLEISNLIIQFLIILIFFSFPINPILINNEIIKKINIFDRYLINIIIYFWIFLFSSIINLNINFFKYLLILKIIIIFFRIKKITSEIKKDKPEKLIFFLICFFILAAQLIVDPRLGWDGVTHWYQKVLNFYQDQNLENIKNLEMAYYPHLGSYLWSVFWKLSILKIEYSGRLVFLFILLISIFSASELIKKININYFLITISLIILVFDKFLLSGYQEYLMFFLFYSFALFFSKNFYLHNNTLKSVIAVMILVPMMWVKQEGFFSIILLMSIFLIYSKIEFRNKILSIVLTLFFYLFYIYIKILFFEKVQFNSEILHEGLLDLFNLKILYIKVILIFKEIFKASIKYPIWLIIYLLLIYNFIRNNLKDNLNKENVFFLFFNAFIFAIFLQSNDDIKQLMPLTLDRIYIQGSGFYLLFITSFFNKILTKKI